MAEMVGAWWSEGVAIYAGALLAWTLGLYVATRGGFRRIPLLVAAAILALVVYQVGQALGALAPDAAHWLTWVRRTWWSAALAPVLWLLLVGALAADEAPATVQPALSRFGWAGAGVLMLAGVCFAVAGSATDLVVRWDLPAAPLGAPHVPPGPLFPVFQAYVVACLGLATALLLFLWRSCAPGTPLRARFGWLLGSAALFLLGGVYITAASGWFGFTSLPGQALLSAGLLIMAWNLARYGALLAGETLRADLVAFSLATAAVVLGYGVLLLAFVPREYAWLERVLPGLLLLVATHALADRQNALLDRFVYGVTAHALRGRLRHLADRVVRQPDAVSALAEVRESVAALVRDQSRSLATAEGRERTAAGESAGSDTPQVGRLATPDLRVLVEGALRRLNDLPALAEHPLLDRVGPRGEGATALERARYLRGELEAAIARLQPPGARPAPGASAGPGGWLHYLVLHEAYVEGRPNKQIMQRYHVSESTFHRARRRAIDALAEDLAARWAHPSAAGRVG